LKSFTKHLWVNTSERVEFRNITHEIERLLGESQIKEGLVLVNAMHITASVYVNDAESGLIDDYKSWLAELVPKGRKYRHNLTGEDNAYAHLMRTVMGREAVVAVTNGRLDLGPWEQIYYAEFDGQRQKRILVKIIGE